MIHVISIFNDLRFLSLISNILCCNLILTLHFDHIFYFVLKLKTKMQKYKLSKKDAFDITNHFLIFLTFFLIIFVLAIFQKLGYHKIFKRIKKTNNNVLLFLTSIIKNEQPFSSLPHIFFLHLVKTSQSSVSLFLSAIICLVATINLALKFAQLVANKAKIHPFHHYVICFKIKL